MNALKNILFFGLLIAVLCGVYLSLSRQPEQPLPPELARQATPPTISGPPALDVTNAPAPYGTASVVPQSPTMKEWPAARGDTAPLFPAQPSPNVPPPPAQGGKGDSPVFAATTQRAVPEIGTVPDTTMSLPPPPGDTPPPSRDPFHNPNYPAGVTNPSRSGSLAASGSLSNAPPPWTGPEVANVPYLGAPPEEHAHTTSIDTILQQVGLKVNEGKLADALLILSPLYDNPDVSEDKAKKITEVLDYMAAKVIYSREDLLEPRYGVRPGDTLESIADRYKVPSLLLARINGISDPQNLSPGKELKVLKGPFIAKVSTARGEMTMMLDGRYAGRFPIKLSSDLQQATGLYRVQAKSAAAANGAAAKPQWIELANATGKIGIEASSELRSANAGHLCTLWLSEQDMDDVYGILSVGSVLIIQR